MIPTPLTFKEVAGGTPHLLDQGSVKLSYSLSVQRSYRSEDFYLGR